MVVNEVVVVERVVDVAVVFVVVVAVEVVNVADEDVLVVIVLVDEVPQFRRHATTTQRECPKLIFSKALLVTVMEVELVVRPQRNMSCLSMTSTHKPQKARSRQQQQQQQQLQI